MNLGLRKPGVNKKPAPAAPLCALLFGLVLAGCGGEPKAPKGLPSESAGLSWRPAIHSPEVLSREAGGYPRRLRDSSGKIVELPRPAERVVSLAPNLTEVIYALGRGGVLVGRTDWCRYPPEALSLPSVGDLTNPGLEAILALNPDLVLGSTHVPLEIMDRLEALGINRAIISAPDNFQGLYQVIAGTAAFLGAEDRGEALAGEIRAREERVRAAGEAWPSRPLVYFALSYGPGGDWTAGGDTFVGSLISAAGGLNLARDVSGWSFSLESLLEGDPDIILLNRGLKADFCRTEPYLRLRAVKEGQVYEVDEDLIVRQGPRLILGLETLQGIFQSRL
jgi:iron complex transport system substrate-binding protein